jgi:hypothetical protein
MKPLRRFLFSIEIKISSFFWKCIVGCIFNFVQVIITREISCIRYQFANIFQQPPILLSILVKNNSTLINLALHLFHFNGLIKTNFIFIIKTTDSTAKANNHKCQHKINQVDIDKQGFKMYRLIHITFRP